MTLDFLKSLHEKYSKLLLIWDKAPNHRARIVQEYIKTHNIKQEWFPSACPEENPMEQAWSQLKARTANTFYKNSNNYKKAVKKQANKKNLVKMFKYIPH